MPKDILEIARETGLRTYLHGVNARDSRAILQKFVNALPSEDERFGQLQDLARSLGQICQDHVVVMQAAYIEWKHGAGAEAAMRWIRNTLDGPGNMPDPDEPYGKEAQAYFDANRANPLPACHCGRPSNIGWMGNGFCCEGHFQEARRAQMASPQVPSTSGG